MTRHLAIIGDVHGDSRRLRRLLASLPSDERHLIFVGDYVNRGPDSRGVLDVLCEIKDRLGKRCSFLFGNHELALMGFLESGRFGEFASLGGIATIRSYLPWAGSDVHQGFVDAFPRAHAEFLASLTACYEEPELLVSHTGYDPSARISRSLEDMAKRAHPDMFSDPCPPTRMVVCGHYVQRGGRPFVRGGLIVLDTGCGTVGGPLTALLLPEHRFLCR